MEIVGKLLGLYSLVALIVSIVGVCLYLGLKLIKFCEK
jgi:hypothetical protein